MPSSIVPTRVSQGRCRYPFAPIGALGARMVVGSAADRIDLGTHERLDEGLNQRAHHVGVSFLHVLAH